MKKILVLLLVLSFFFNLSPVFSEETEEEKTINASAIFFMPIGSEIDNSFIQISEKGIKIATHVYPNIKIARVYPYSADYIHEYIKYTAQRGHQYIIGIGSHYREAFKKVAAGCPKNHFILIDDELDLPNVKSIVFNNFEAGFMAGIVAGIITKTNQTGFIGACEKEPVLSFKNGFIKGIDQVNAKCRVKSLFISKDGSGFSDKTKAYSIADEMYKSDIDVVFAAAGPSGLGAIDAARNNRKYIIGVDADQDSLAQGYIATSVVKKLDNAIVNMVDSISSGKFTSDKLEYNVGNIGFTLTDFSYTKNKIGKDSINRINDEIYKMKMKYKNSLTNKIKGTHPEDIKDKTGK